MPEKPPVVLTIAGFDPSSGAGVTADIKTIAAHSCYGVACITALTVQSTAGVKRVEMVDSALIAESLEELAEDLDISAVHIGMLGSGKVVKVVADFLSGATTKGSSNRAGKSAAAKYRVGSDPEVVLRSGAVGCGWNQAADRETDPSGRRPHARTSTKRQSLTGMQVKDLDEMKAASAKLHEMGAAALVITGGHLDKAIDLLSFMTPHGIEQEVFKAERQRSNSTHGTGCAFATAMACHLALDRGLAEAALLAKTYVTAAISNGQPLGRGTGPVHHLYRMSQQKRAAGSGSGVVRRPQIGSERALRVWHVAWLCDPAGKSVSRDRDWEEF